MDITFRNIVPIPLASIQHHTESIWGKEFTLKKGSKVLLNANSGKGKSTFLVFYSEFEMIIRVNYFSMN